MACEDHLSAAQARHVLATFRHVDELLARAQSPLDRKGGESSLAAVCNDFTPQDAAALREAIAAVRTELQAGAHTLELPATGEPISARWAAATSTRLALIALAELDAKHLSAYGVVNDAAVERVAEARAGLEEKLEALRRLLDRP
jgi:hypothetical protein